MPNINAALLQGNLPLLKSLLFRAEVKDIRIGQILRFIDNPFVPSLGSVNDILRTDKQLIDRISANSGITD